MTELLDRGAAAIAAAVRTGKTSARDVAEAAIARVEARNKALTAIREVSPRGHAAFTPLFNLALVTGISVPCGSGRDGLPFGLPIEAQQAEAALG
jgi:Asp-tRNA(Asn)/Glu-tRNA(Gln) amidotransferase A subunit family amidase